MYMLKTNCFKCNALYGLDNRQLGHLSTKGQTKFSRLHAHPVNNCFTVSLNKTKKRTLYLYPN